MLILAIDTALTVCSVAVFDTHAQSALAVQSVPMDKGHAEALMPMVASCLSLAGLKAKDCGRMATTVGPGSFTGLRVGISAARGLALAVGCPCIGINTLDALAAPFRSEHSSAVASCIDARHGHVFFALYRGSGILVAPALLSAADAAAAASRQDCRLIGSGAGEVAGAWPADAAASLLVDLKAGPDILDVARLATRVDPELAPARPLYLRAPDAKPSTHLALERQ